jgi:phosphinothricin acetyltransferase
MVRTTATNMSQAVKMAAATERHLKEITEIYNDAIINTTATFDSKTRSLREQGEWMGQHDDRHPIIVATLDGGVVGWGSLSEFSDRCCYQQTVEDSVYVRKEYRGRGIGRMLLERLLGEARKAGHHTIVARIDGGNEASLRLHREMGFREVGSLREVGFKFGRWLDVVIMQMLL